MKYLKQLCKELGYELRHYTQVLKANEKSISIFEFSEQNDGTFDSFKYYNNYYLVKLKGGD